MGRQEELEQMIAASVEYPKNWDRVAVQKKVKRKAGLHYMAVSLRSAAAVFAVVLSGFCIMVNTSEAFAKELEGIPVLNKVAQWMNFLNIGYQESLDSGYVNLQDVSVQGENVKLTFPYVMADDRKLVILYEQMSLVPEKEYYIFPKKIVNADTGEELENLFSSFGDGNANGFEFDWNKFVEKVQVTFGVYSAQEYDILGSPEELLTVTLDTGEKKTAREYIGNYDFTVGSQHYTIDHVAMYPLSTVITLRTYNDWNENWDFIQEITQHIDFYLTDGETRRNSDRVSTSVMPDGDLWEIEMESGYFAMKEQEIKLGISAVYLLPEDRREVYLDLDKGYFYDAYGKDPMLQVIDSPVEDCLAVSFVTEDPNLDLYTYNIPFFFEGYDDEDAVTMTTIEEGDKQKNIFLIKKTALHPDETGIVKGIRSYPTDIFTFGEQGTQPTLEIPLQLKEEAQEVEDNLYDSTKLDLWFEGGAEKNISSFKCRLYAEDKLIIEKDFDLAEIRDNKCYIDIDTDLLEGTDEVAVEYIIDEKYHFGSRYSANAGGLGVVITYISEEDCYASVLCG